MWAMISRWLATRTATFVVAGFVSAAFVFYIQQGRVCCAELKGRETASGIVTELTKELKEGIDSETDRAIREIRQTPYECRDVDAPPIVTDSLRDK